MSLCTWKRYRRIDPSAEFFLRCDRIKTDLRNRFPLRIDRLWFFLRSDRTGGKRCDRLCDNPGAIASYDKKDSTSVKREDYDFTSALVDDVKGMRIGIPRDYFGEGLDPEVKEAILAAAKVLEEKELLWKSLI